MSSQVEQIKERLGIVDVISQYVKLEKAGSNFKARCPFHNEKTPSFFVSPARNSYYCFGCNAKGDIFSFVERFEGLDFVGALKTLGEKAGIQVVFEKQGEKDKSARLYDIMEAASLFFEENLKREKKITKYLHNRGLKDKTINDWRIGYSHKSWSNLYDYLKKSYSALEIEKAGLIKKKESGNNYYDRFRGRIMFPIFDNSGRVIAFSGRIFEGDEKDAKYINSPETALFSKSKILYGYDRAKFSIRKLNFSIVVEGQMDLLMSHQSGFTNTVALSGTALTLEHIGILKRLSSNIIFAFDSDPAGIASSGKSAIQVLSYGMDVKVASLKQGDDPADVLNKSKEEWKRTIKNSKHIVDFYLDIFSETINDKRKLRLRVGQIVLPYIKRIPNKIDQAHFVSVVAHKLGVSEDAVREELDKVRIEENGDYISGNVEENNATRPERGKLSSIENKLAGIIIWQKSAQNPKIDIETAVSGLERVLGKEKVLQMLGQRDDINELLFEAENFHSDDERLSVEVEELILNLEREYMKEDLNKILSELKFAETGDNADKTAKLLKKYKELSDKLSDINILK